MATQSYWRKKPSRIPIWKQKNDDSKLGKKLKASKKDLEEQDNKKYSMKEYKEMLGEPTIQEWKEED